jgi:hypothetical protein
MRMVVNLCDFLILGGYDVCSLNLHVLIVLNTTKQLKTLLKQNNKRT